MVSIKFSYDEVKKTAKPVDALWTVLFIDPIALRTVYWIANHLSWLKPNYITIIGTLAIFSSFFCFLQSSRQSMIIGAILFETSFILDCIDGKLARLTGSKSELGGKLDYFSGRLYTYLCFSSITLSQGFLEGDNFILLAGVSYIFISTVLTLLSSINVLNTDSTTSAYTYNTPNHVLAFLLDKYFSLRKRFANYRLAVLPSEVEALNLALFIAPILGYTSLGIMLALIIMAKNLTVYIIATLIKKRM